MTKKIRRRRHHQTVVVVVVIRILLRPGRVVQAHPHGDEDAEGRSVEDDVHPVKEIQVGWMSS